MHIVAGIDRIRELHDEITLLAKLNAFYKTDTSPSEFMRRAQAGRALRLLEIRAELESMKREFRR